MRLWTSLPIERLPDFFQNGLIDRYHEGIEFHLEADLVAEYAMEFVEELAFLEVEFPDSQIDDWLTICIEAASAEATNREAFLQEQVDQLEALLEEDPTSPQIPEFQEVIAQDQEILTQIEDMTTGSQSLELLGSACIYQVVPISMIKLLDPETMLEAVWTGDVGIIADAVETTEATGLESLGGPFWVWLMYLFQNMFAVARGAIDVEPLWKTEAAKEKAEARKARRRAARRRKGSVKKPRKKRPKKGSSLLRPSIRGC